MSTAPLELDVDREAWERQRDESAAAFRAFVAFRDLGLDRSLIAAFRVYAGRPAAVDASSSFRAWRHRHAWDERCALFDREQDRLRLLAQRRAVFRMRERQATSALELHERAAAALLRVLPQVDELEGDQADVALQRLLRRVSAAELLRAFDLGCKVERLALGEPTELAEHSIRATVRAMTPDEALAFSGLAE